jgi:hypothetical protein
MTTPFTLGVPIPSILWSSLEDVLSTNMRLFAKDIAKTLGRPEAPLLHALNADKIRPYIFESEERCEIDMCCAVLCVKPEAPQFLQRCGHPIVWTSDTGRCMEHLSHKSSAPPTSLPILQRLDYKKGEQTLYVSEDSTVYTAENLAVGQFVEGVLTLFSIEEDSDAALQ